MSRALFSEHEIEELFHRRHTHPNPRVRMRLEALYLKASGLGTLQVCKLVRISRSTLMLWIRLWEKGGMQKICSFDFKGGKRSALTPHREKIISAFSVSPPLTLDEACARIYQMTGVTRARSSVRDFLIEIGIHKPRQSES